MNNSPINFEQYFVARCTKLINPFRQDIQYLSPQDARQVDLKKLAFLALRQNEILTMDGHNGVLEETQFLRDYVDGKYDLSTVNNSPILGMPTHWFLAWKQHGIANDLPAKQKEAVDLKQIQVETTFTSEQNFSYFNQNDQPNYDVIGLACLNEGREKRDAGHALDVAGFQRFQLGNLYNAQINRYGNEERAFHYAVDNYVRQYGGHLCAPMPDTRFVQRAQSPFPCQYTNEADQKVMAAMMRQWQQGRTAEKSKGRGLVGKAVHWVTDRLRDHAHSNERSPQ